MRTVITLSLDDAFLRAAREVARAREISIQQLLKDALRSELARTHRPAKTSARTDERLLAPLRVLLAADLAMARGWQDLNARLAGKGFELREAGGGLAVFSRPGGRRQCKASELGQSYADLMRRFGQPFPGHGHVWLAQRVLGRTDDDGAVTEPF